MTSFPLKAVEQSTQSLPNRCRCLQKMCNILKTLNSYAGIRSTENLSSPNAKSCSSTPSPKAFMCHDRGESRAKSGTNPSLTKVSRLFARLLQRLFCVINTLANLSVKGLTTRGTGLHLQK